MAAIELTIVSNIIILTYENIIVFRLFIYINNNIKIIFQTQAENTREVEYIQKGHGNLLL